MTAAARRQQLHQFIDAADDRKIESLFEYIENTAGPVTQAAYNKWDDPEFAGMIERRTKALEEGTDKGMTWEEIRKNAIGTKK